MASLTKVDLEKLEKEHGLEPGDLTYQQRVSRVTAVRKGEPWESPKAPEVKRGTVTRVQNDTPTDALRRHPLFGKRILITPMMTMDKDRAIYFDEPVGHDIQVEEIEAGKLLYGEAEKVDRMVGSYKIINENPNRIITAKTSLPKSGQEITWLIGEDLVPVVRGNDGQMGYIWSFPTHTRQVGDTVLQFFGLQTLITQIAPELLSKFSGKPVMMEIDGLVLAASIPQTKAILKEFKRRERQDAKLGL